MHDDDPRVAFWSDPGRVKRFSGRDPDHRLLTLISRYPDPAAGDKGDLSVPGMVLQIKK